MHATRLLFVASLLGSCLVSASYAASLTGLVTSSTRGNPMPNATVTLQPIGRETSTDRSGRYRFANVAPGEYTVSVRFLGYDQTTQSVIVPETGEVHVDIQLSSSGDVVVLEDFVVEGIREGQARALQQKRMSDSIMDAVSADAVGKFPDGNAAEALRRMPGVSVEIDQDEGRYVVVRGIDAALNTVTLNNQLIGTPSEQGNRGIGMDSVPADLISRLEVTKAVTPDMDGTAIGGSVNIVTLSAFDRPEGFLFGSVAGFYDSFRSRTEPNGSINFGRTFGEGKWGFVAGASYSLKNFGSQTSDAVDWTEEGGFFIPQTVESFDYNIERERIGVNVALQYRPDGNNEYALRINHNEFSDTEGRQNSDFEFARGNLTNQTANSGTFSQGRATREFRDYHQTWTIQALSLEGSHTLPANYNFKWQVGASRGERDVPIRHDWEFRSSGSAFPNSYQVNPRGVTVVSPAANFFDPASYPFRRIRLRHDLEREDVFSAQADLRRDVRFGDRNGYWKVGAKYVTRDKADDRENEDYDPADENFTLAEGNLAGPEPANFMEGRYRFGPTINLPAMHAFFASNPDRFEYNELSSIQNSTAGDFEANEDVLAVYAMAGIDLTSQLEVLGGVRVEYTDAEYAANELIFDDGDFTGVVNRVEGTEDYSTVMPGVHLIWRPNDRLVARAAWTNTLGRANYVDLAPIREFDQVEEEPGSGVWQGSISEGNPLLKPYESMNWDASLEYYLESGGIVSVGVFHKDIDNPVYESSFFEEDVTVDGRFYSILSTSRPENARSGRITGVEFNYQQFFTFLPSPFDGLGVNMNYTITDSSATLLTQNGRKVPFFKQADNTGNFALVYEKYGIEARLAYAITGDYLTSIGSGPDMDGYIDERKVWDAKVSYRLNENFTIFAEFLNLNEQPLREFVGIPTRNSGYEIYGWKSRFGVNFRM